MIRPPMRATYPQGSSLRSPDEEQTQPQRDLLRDLTAKLRIPSAPLDDYAKGQFGQPVALLSRREMSALLTEMLTWKAAPDAIKRAMGQLDLF